jgi:hypothetical protein
VPAATLKSILGIGEGALKCVAILSVLFSNLRRETMKTMLLAAAAAFSLGVGSAYADGGDGPAANTQFTELPGVIAQAPMQNAPVVATAQNGEAIHTYVTNSNHGTWLFAPNQNQGNGS